jgi:hypothetical protein
LLNNDRMPGNHPFFFGFGSDSAALPSVGAAFSSPRCVGPARGEAMSAAAAALTAAKPPT